MTLEFSMEQIEPSTRRLVKINFFDFVRPLHVGTLKNLKEFQELLFQLQSTSDEKSSCKP